MNMLSINYKGVDLMSLVKKLYGIPFGTAEHARMLKKVQSTLKYNEYVLCTYGRFDEKRAKEADNDLVKDTKLTNIFPNGQTVFENPLYYFVHRNSAEYNSAHRQINVGTLLYDDNGQVLVMKKKCNGTFGLIGGHTEYDPSCYIKSVAELCHYHMVKEFKEELSTDYDPKDLPSMPTFMINDVETFWDLHHSWFVYIKKVDDFSKYKFKSGEDKISVHLKDIDWLIADTKDTKYSLQRACILLKEYMESGSMPANVLVQATTPKK